MQKKVLVALSGGVDSGVAAALLVQQGYDVTGVHLKLGSVAGAENGFDKLTTSKCCDASSLGRVVALCEHLKIPLKVLDFSREFADVVIHEFLDDYRRGLTPNPCVVCNKEIKIGGLLKWAITNKFDYLATGHYCRISDNFCLRQAEDKKKDQSYFLWTLYPEQIRQLLFPIGEMSKEEVRMMAKELELPVAEARESFDVCFIGERSAGVEEFLRQNLPVESFKDGEVNDTAGKVIGRHFGLPLYTIGQRKGFTITSKKYAGQVLYVVGKEAEKNLLVVGSKEEASMRQFTIYNLQFTKEFMFGEQTDLKVRVRHQGELVPVREIRAIGEIWEIVLSEPVMGVAPGQSAVFYRNEELVGGGIIY